MEITNSVKGKQFRDIIWGECFMSDGDVYIRIKGPDKAVLLSDGELCTFDEDCLVQPVEARVVINEDL